MSKKSIFSIDVVLSEKEIEVLQELHRDCEWCIGYDSICSNTKIDKKEAKKIIKRLRGLELVEYVRGLMTEDGEVAGSGFCRTTDGNRVIEEYEK